jgi:hypothetical protein
MFDTVSLIWLFNSEADSASSRREAGNSDSHGQHHNQRQVCQPLVLVINFSRLNFCFDSNLVPHNQVEEILQIPTTIVLAHFFPNILQAKT